MSPRRETAIMLDMPTSFEGFSPVAEAPLVRNKLSPAEIEALLRPDLSDMPDDPPPPEPVAITPKDIPDFHAPAAPTTSTAIPEDAMRLAARLSLALRQRCGLRAAATVAGTGEGSFLAGLATHADEIGRAIACFAAPSGEIVAMLSLSAPLSGALIETACGGQPTDSAPRELTPLDGALLEGLVRPLGTAISPSLSFARIETDADFAAALARPGAADIIDLDIRLDHGRMGARLILAADDLFDSAPAGGLAAPEPHPHRTPATPAPVAAAAGVTAVLTARIASLSVPLSRLSDLKAGSTLLLGLPADQPVELLSGGRNGPVAAEAQIGRKGAQMALRITRRGPAIRDLG
ncbi:flagellar motor switch protein FliM [Hyphomonas johnsonii]|uniref:SPOA domain-containing protein n=1 Tax=Hyphomonas johnsonii MHS-2 TaxID=1280950 RepID=A0A059FJC3_9PROT|nr:flagellar motor switch protein FliM [Hyphomonas johnsonii]KCZ90770.1 SPOA domain-containing protein [Hyphomonas johnsonii MHS-2]